MSDARKVGEATEKAAGNRGKGRKRGVPNKATRDIKEIAQPYSAEAIGTLAAIMRDVEAQAAARVAAANALLDRGYGKPSQTVAVDQTLTIIDDRDETEALIRNLTGGEPPVARPADGTRRIAKVVH